MAGMLKQRKMKPLAQQNESDMRQPHAMLHRKLNCRRTLFAGASTPASSMVDALRNQCLLAPLTFAWYPRKLRRRQSSLAGARLSALLRLTPTSA